MTTTIQNLIRDHRLSEDIRQLGTHLPAKSAVILEEAANFLSPKEAAVAETIRKLRVVQNHVLVESPTESALIEDAITALKQKFDIP